MGHTAGKKYSVSKEDEVWAVCRNGLILVTFSHKHEAVAHLQAQLRADEQSEVMAEFNAHQEVRALAADFMDELRDLAAA